MNHSPPPPEAPPEVIPEATSKVPGAAHVPELHIQVMSGVDAGKRLVFTQSPLTFGRSRQNDISFDLPTASRRHGELRYEDTGWRLVNLSENGTQLAGKKVTTKPRLLPPDALVAIGGEPVMRLEPTPAADAKADSPNQTATTKSKLSGRSKVWLGIGIYLLLMLGLFVFFGTLGNDGEAAIASVPELTDEQIRSAIRLSPPPTPPDARRSREALIEARELFALVDVEPDALYRAHEAYGQAMRYARDQTFEDSLDQRRYLYIEQQLTDEVTQRYQRAYNMLRSRQFDAAADQFQKLTEFYPKPTSEVFQNAQKQWEHAVKELQRRR